MQSHHLLSSAKRLNPLLFPMSTMATSTTTKDVQLLITPQSCLQDEPVKIQVQGLSPGQVVTLHTSTKDVRGAEFMAHAHYRANTQGEVDVTTMESEGGRYTGNFPMGLIAGMAPAPHVYKYTRFFKRDVENPNKIEASVFDGHLTDQDLYADTREDALASIVHERHYMAPGVQRIPVRYGRVRATLFLPPGDGPFPGVVDMFGTAGGLLEYRSAQLASRGFASLALAFFAFEDLPKTLEEFDIAYFEEAVDFLLKHEKINDSGVGVIGTSKGGDLALSMASFIPQVKATVVINGCIAPIEIGFHTHNGFIPPVNFDTFERLRVHDDCVLYLRQSLSDPRLYPERILPIEKSNSAFLFLVSVDDQDLNSELYAQMGVQILKKNNYDKPYEVCSYPGAGHLLEPPYSFFCSASFQHSVMMVPKWGGSLKFHSLAQEKAWIKLRQYLLKHLGTCSHQKSSVAIQSQL
ncbi:acyl-coenzyme A thioesterase 1-like isoform X1 [Oratosquilla oratoria]|uniref:acyl-coenzyme A thioesterase 1-like isoform X1 n=1 Tax=Oratosquilla oratoria TaxID=337810 RepID=UPI003F766A5D